jgi:hypothetical protein
MSTIIVVSFGTAFLLGFIKNLCFIAGGVKMHVKHPQKTLRFLDGFAFRHSGSTSFLFRPTCEQSWQ